MSVICGLAVKRRSGSQYHEATGKTKKLRALGWCLGPGNLGIDGWALLSLIPFSKGAPNIGDDLNVQDPFERFEKDRSLGTNQQTITHLNLDHGFEDVSEREPRSEMSHRPI